MTDSEKITKAFKALRKKGWFARKNFWCCQTCGCAAVPHEYFNKFVFYHNQDAEALKEIWGKKCRGNISDGGLYLTHGEGGNGKEICNALVNAGLTVEWDESNDTRILVKHNETETGTYKKVELRHSCSG